MTQELAVASAGPRGDGDTTWNTPSLGSTREPAIGRAPTAIPTPISSTTMSTDFETFVREGETPDEADDVLVLDDREILRAVGSLIARRLGVGSIPRPLRSVANRPPAGRTGASKVEAIDRRQRARPERRC